MHAVGTDVNRSWTAGSAGLLRLGRQPTEQVRSPTRMTQLGIADYAWSRSSTDRAGTITNDDHLDFFAAESRSSTDRAGAITGDARALPHQKESSRSSTDRAGAITVLCPLPPRLRRRLDRQPTEQVRSRVLCPSLRRESAVSIVNRPSRCDHRLPLTYARILRRLDRQPTEQVRSPSAASCLRPSVPRVSIVNRPSRCDHPSVCQSTPATAVSRSSTDRAGAITVAPGALILSKSVSIVNRPSRCDHLECWSATPLSVGLDRQLTEQVRSQKNRLARRASLRCLDRQPTEQVRSRERDLDPRHRHKSRSSTDRAGAITATSSPRR